MRYLNSPASVFLFILLLLAAPLAAQESGSGSDDMLNEDVDSLFDGGSEEEAASEQTSDGADAEEEKEERAAETEEEQSGDLLSELEKKPGLSFSARYNMKAGYALDFDARPWEWGSDSGPRVSHDAVAALKSTFDLDVQLSPELRVKQSFRFEFPDFTPDMETFYADYNVENQLFFRLGLQSITWGLSRTYPFSNIPERTPPGTSDDGDIYAIKMNVPVGIGGFEALALTRKGFIADTDNPRISEVGIGGKYNLALPAADINIGTFFHKLLKYRSFYSIKTTLFDRVEVYQEGMMGIDWTRDYRGMSFLEVLQAFDFSGSIGFYDDFFGTRLQVNGEYFFNGETAGNDFDLENEEEPSPFIYGHNAALTLSYKPGSSSLRLLARYKHNFTENSGYLVPGITFSPLPDVRVSFAAPTVLGAESGSYYQDNKKELFRLAVGVSVGEKFEHRFDQ